MSTEKRGENFVIKDEGPSPIEFTTFVVGLASTALIHLGEAPNPETGQAEKNLPMAQQTLDLLGLLKLKTQGNLTPEEQKLFDELLADLRLRFVDAVKP